MSNWYKSTHYCANCGDEFKATRSDAAYCSPKCRKQVSLERQKMRRLIDVILTNISTLQIYAENDMFTKEANAGLNEISNLFNFTDTPGAAAAASGSRLPGAASVQASMGTDQSSSGKSVATGADTSNAVQLDVKSLQYDIRELTKRVNELENAIDWRQVAVR